MAIIFFVVQTRRGDLEILAYNLLQWLGCKLPWMNLLKNPKDVQESKEKYMKEIPKFIQMCFGKRSPPGKYRRLPVLLYTCVLIKLYSHSPIHFK